MHLCTVLCIFSLTWISSQSLHEWNNYIWKTVYDCLKFNQSIRDLVTQRIISTTCYQGTWEKRIRSKTLIKESLKSNHSFVTPYTHIQHSFRGVQYTKIQINVLRLFKLNLTLIRLDIQRSLAGCIYGKLTVS